MNLIRKSMLTAGNTRRKYRYLKAVLCLFLLSVPAVLPGCRKETLDSHVLQTQMNEFIAELKTDGTMQTLQERWYSDTKTGADLDFSALNGENGVILFGTISQKPFAQKMADSYEGIVPELVCRFCRRYGYGVEFREYSDANALVMAVSTGKCDMAGSVISVTEERKKSVDFSDSYYENRVVVVMNREDAEDYTAEASSMNGKRVGIIAGSAVREIVLGHSPKAEIYEYKAVADLCETLSKGKVDVVVDDYATIRYALRNYENETVVDTLASDDYYAFVFRKSGGDSRKAGGRILESLKRSFIQEDRWVLVLQGVGCTLLITALSVLIGGFAGFLLCMAVRKNNKVVNRLIGVFSWLIRGLPTVVLLLIMYYVVFGAFSVSGTVVATISFSLVFAITVCGLLSDGIRSVDRGQFEACAALGYKDNEGFMKIILPQVIRFALPGFKTEVIALIKATSIVGYIAVQDLTKAADIIRSSTYEAFAPLLLTAAIYFFLAWILTKIVDLIQKTVVKRTSLEKFLKGVDCHAGN